MSNQTSLCELANSFISETQQESTMVKRLVLWYTLFNLGSRVISLELYQLHYFRAIANFGSMAAAAGAINVTQPSLSYAVSQLEKELGVTLFLRRGGKLQLTSMGEILLETADRILKELDACAEQVRAEGAQSAGRVYIGVPYNGLISEAVTSFIQMHPMIHLFAAK